MNFTEDIEIDESIELEQQATELLVADLQESAPINSQNDSVNSSGSAQSASIELENIEDEWAKMVVKLGLVGTLEQIAFSSQLDWLNEDKVSFKVSPKLDLICTDSAKAGIEEAMIVFLDKKLTFEWSFAEAERETPAMIFERLAKEKHQKACESLDTHPFSQELKQHFSAQLITQSVGYLS